MLPHLPILRYSLPNATLPEVVSSLRFSSRYFPFVWFIGCFSVTVCDECLPDACFSISACHECLTYIFPSLFVRLLACCLLDCPCFRAVYHYWKYANAYMSVPVHAEVVTHSKTCHATCRNTNFKLRVFYKIQN